MRPIAAALLPWLLLSGCAYLLDSPFPAYVPLMEEQVDVADVMPYEQGAHYEMRVVSSPVGDFVWLYGEGTGFGEKFALFDADLSLLVEAAEVAGNNTFWADSVLIFNGTLYCIGTRVYDAAFGPPTAATWGQGMGYYDPATARFTFPYLTMPDSINWELWSLPTASIGPVAGGTISGGLYSYNGFEALYHDVPGGRVALYARPSYGNAVHGVVAPAANFSTSLANPLISDTRAFQITTESPDFDRPQFAGDGTVIYYHDDELLVFYDLAGNKGETISPGDLGDTRVAFSPHGKYWYIFEPSLGRVVKARTWW